VRIIVGSSELSVTNPTRPLLGEGMLADGRHQVGDADVRRGARGDGYPLGRDALGAGMSFR